LRSGALGYLIAHNGEAGHLCPVACTAGAIKLIQHVGSEEQKFQYLSGLLEKDYSKRLHAAQFLTEIQGGSDVGANSCVAIPGESPGTFHIHGEKWFCSVMDAGLFVVTARPEGAQVGTRGLGLFLLPRIYQGSINGFSVRRLKPKLGTRSMATGETEFHGAFAEQIGQLEEGFKNAVRIVLDTSRVHNAVSACGILRRVYVEARTFAERRRAFGNPILHYPLVRRALAQIRAESCAALATTFHILSMTDRLSKGVTKTEENLARRVHVMINKYWTSLQTTRMVRNGIEVLGGNGTIEDFSILPRLYRDAIVLESWEGTHNTLCLQVLRDFQQRAMHSEWFTEIRHRIQNLRNVNSERATAIEKQVTDSINRLLDCPDSDAQLFIRSVVDSMCILHAYTSMLELAESGNHKQLWVDLAEYYVYNHSAPTDFPDSHITELEKRITANL
jgi:alkylation response protein AidB-like acyl-CoA dehydrogenase